MSRSPQKPVELMLPTLRPLTQAKEAVRELLAVIRQYGAYPHWAGALQITQEAARVRRRLAVVNADKDPPGGTINCDEQIAAGGLIGHSLPDR